MQNPYEILSFGSYSEKSTEPRGTKRKYWIEHTHEGTPSNWLFKIPREGTGEGWAEKAAYEFAALIGLPAARVELATLELDGDIISGTASQSFTPDSIVLVHGNELLETVVKGYEKKKRYHQQKHRIDAIFSALKEFALAAPLGLDEISAARCFVGYIVFDGWITNVDRHHENWGMIVDRADITQRLAPTYDHASCLGRLLTDSRRMRILEGRERLTVKKFVSRSDASGAIYPIAGDKGIPPWKLVADLKELGYGDAITEWIQKINDVPREAIQHVFDRFPKGWISKPAIRFATKILETTPHLMKREMDL